MLLVCVFALHLVLGASMGLSVDEAHYALYALHPAWSYFDHPPFVGWVQWPLVAVDAPVVVLRLIPGGLWLVTVWGVHQLALRLHMTLGRDESPAWVGFWAVLVLAVAPLIHVLGIGLLPDTLLMAFTVALMWQTLTLMQTDAVNRLVPWLVLGVLLGCAGLSKYTAILLAFAVALSLLVVHGWRLLRNGWLWACVGIALLMVLPVVFWNANNHWVSFSYQAKHGAGSTWRAVDVLIQNFR